MGCKNFKYFLGLLEISDIFWGLTVDAGSEPTYAKKNRVPPLGSWVLKIKQHTRWKNVFNGKKITVQTLIIRS